MVEVFECVGIGFGCDRIDVWSMSWTMNEWKMTRVERCR